MPCPPCAFRPAPRGRPRATVGEVAEHAVPPEKLRRRLDPESLGFRSTAELAPLRGPLGQARAMEALRFGVGIDVRGYNLFVTGLSGSGRTSMVRAFLEEV